MESEPFHSWLPRSQFHSKTSCWKPLELQYLYTTSSGTGAMRAIILSTNDPHQGSRAFLLPTSKGTAQPTQLQGRGCPPLQTEREWSCQVRQRAMLSSFLLRIHPMCISSSCSVPGTRGTNTLPMALCLRTVGDSHGAVTTQQNSRLCIFDTLCPVDTPRTAPSPTRSQGPCGSSLHSPATLLP